MKVIDTGKIVYDGHGIDPTIEGPKFYKRNNYYYIFAPAGGVSTGWQTVLRSKNIFGPYERRVVMDQGTTTINGPHQGAWVDTKSGEDWFIHFQDKDTYGRVVHLQPMSWKNDWPGIGVDKDGDGKGEPVTTFKKPNVGGSNDVKTPIESDEFDTDQLGLQWQWQANPKSNWIYLNPSTGYLRLYSVEMPTDAKNLWDVPNVLMQKFPADQFVATTKMTFKPNEKISKEIAGLVVMGKSYAFIGFKSNNGDVDLVYSTCKNADGGSSEIETILKKAVNSTIYIRVLIKDSKCKFGYSLDGQKFTELDGVFSAEPGRWIGAKVGLFCTRSEQTNDSGYADFDWFRVEKVK
jgi:beta-xylosidase